MTNKILNEEQLLREVIRGLLKRKLAEATASSPEAPYDITAMNFLRTLLQNIIPKLESSYKSLTTSDIQRKSFRAHILNGVDDLLKTVDETPELSAEEANTGDTDLEEEIEIDVGESKPEEEGFIDITDAEPEPEIPEEEKFGKGLEGTGLDNTGRNSAYTTFKEISSQVEDTYQKIDIDSLVPAAKIPEIGKDSSERFVFKTYLLKNLQLYFDKFEQDLSQIPEEPQVSV